jgi:Peptidase family M28
MNTIFETRLLSALASIFSAVTLAIAPAHARNEQTNIRAAAVEAHTRYLASDLLEGREPGTRGYDLAAAYVAAQFAALGLKPGGDSGSWFQSVPLRTRTLEHVSMAIRTRGDTMTVQNGVDVAVDAGSVAKSDSVQAPLVFVGWGISAPSLGHNDYAGLDVRGKVVVLFEGAPATFPGALRAHYGWVDQKAAMAVAHGAVAILTIKTPTREAVSPWERARVNRPRPAMSWIARDGMVGNRFAVPAITLGPEAAKRLFAASGHDLAEIMTRSEQGKVDGFALDSSLDFRRTSRHADTASPNVLAILPGSDPKLRNEYVFVTGHLDHVGIGPAVKGDSIYNGAADNAGGIAVILEVARALASGPRPKRSIVFLATTAEEKGLLGATYYTEYPTIPLGQIAAVINIDGLMAFFDFSDIVALGADHSTLGQISGRVAKLVSAREVPDPIPERGNLALSDQYPFLRAGIPVLFPLPGRGRGRDGSNGDAEWQAFMTTRYHQPSDDLNQPWRWDVAARWGDYLFEVVRQTANARQRPAWHADDPLGAVFGKGSQKQP